MTHNNLNLKAYHFRRAAVLLIGSSAQRCLTSGESSMTPSNRPNNGPDNCDSEKNSQTAKIIAIHPRACVWIVRHTSWRNRGAYRYEAWVFDYENGMTAEEAWIAADIRYDASSVPVPFYECVCIAAQPWPYAGVEDIKSKVIVR